MTKILKKDPSSPRKEYLIQGLPLATRSLKDYPDWGDDDWYFIDGGDHLTARFATTDGEDFEEIEIDLTQGGLGVGDNLFERVGFTRDYVSKSLEYRLEDEQESDNDDDYNAESIQSLTM